MACFTLPPALFPFYKTHIDYITIHAVDPDKRRYSDPAEAPRHYIDLDQYGESPFDSIPIYWKDAVEKFSEDSLMQHGIVPWHIQKMYYRLTNAFSEKNISSILYYSSHIGHYIGDAHVPLHTTRNYNGQLTNQVGIHGLWESRLPELFNEEYDFFVGSASYIENIQEYVWMAIQGSFMALDSVLDFEKMLHNVFDTDRKYAFETRGNQLMKVYSREYSEKYHDELSGQVERRMQAAILAIGSIWYTAWVDAGMPSLNFKADEEITSPSDDVVVLKDTTRNSMRKRECD
jgi:hypothetical protein